MQSRHLDDAASYDKRAESYAADRVEAEQAGNEILAAECGWWEYRMRLAARRARTLAAEARHG